jgi:hypothetical protein
MLAEGALKTMFKNKFKVITAVLVIVGMIGLGIGLFLHHRRTAEQDAAKDNALAAKLQGEWSRPGDNEFVWTFRPNGFFRIDAIDQETVKHIGMTGLWRVEKGDLYLVVEVWDSKFHYPVQTIDRMRIWSVSESELALLPLEEDDRRLEGGNQLQFTRFAGWPQKQDSERLSALKALSDFFRRFAK